MKAVVRKQFELSKCCKLMKHPTKNSIICHCSCELKNFENKPETWRGRSKSSRGSDPASGPPVHHRCSRLISRIEYTSLTLQLSSLFKTAYIFSFGIKSKGILITGCVSVLGCQMLGILHRLDNWLIDVGKDGSPTHWPLSTPQKHNFSASGTHFC
jgi:hypothetical protein